MIVGDLETSIDEKLLVDSSKCPREGIRTLVTCTSVDMFRRVARYFSGYCNRMNG